MLSKSAAADRRARRFAQACALTVGAVGLLTMMEYASGRSLGIINSSSTMLRQACPPPTRAGWA